MGTSSTRNVERQSSSGVLIESEDDDPGIRGLSSSRTSSKHHRNNFPIKQNPATDFLDAAIIDQSQIYSGNAAFKLDQFVLGKTEVAPEFAQGSLSTSTNSAISSLKDVASSNITRGNKQLQGNLNIASPSNELASSPGALTWSSASINSASTGSTDDSVDTPEEEFPTNCFRDAFYSMPIKSMIKRVCVAGLEPRGKGSRKFCLSVDEIRDICRIAQDRFLSEPSLLRLDAPVKIVGDLHGQFRDLMRLFKKGGMPPSQHYLFLGDYVDRGKQSLETITLLLLLKLRYPSHVHILRGNHECAGVTKVYGFYDECKRRSSLKAWRSIIDVFNTLPVAAIVGGRIFCVHGGISPSLSSFSQIEAIQRPTDVPESGILADLLWADPDPQVKEWAPNDRGVSFCFGQRSIEKFSKQFGIDLIVRGHMVVEDGYEFFAGRRLVTVFSASNYCGDFDNYGAMVSISADLVCSFDIIEPKTKMHVEAAERARKSALHERSKQSSHGSRSQHHHHHRRETDVLLA